MWTGLYNLRTAIASHELLQEVLIRVTLLLVACLMQLGVKPHVRYISKVDLLSHYKCPRRQSIVPPWATVFVVIIVPLFFFALPLCLTQNHVDITQSFLAWTLALSFNAVCTEVIKLGTGRPRPDFFYRCFPDGRITKGLICTGDTKDILDGRKSFPSGHSSFSFCSMGFLSLWLCGRLGVLSRRRGRVAGVLTCFSPLVVASGVAVSRYLDNHHHWGDVIAGSLLGFVASYFCYIKYFYPLDSDMSGCPKANAENFVFISRSSQTECTTRTLAY